MNLSESYKKRLQELSGIVPGKYEVFYHQTDEESAKKILKNGFNTPEVWAAPDDEGSYGDVAITVYAPKPKKPFIMDIYQLLEMVKYKEISYEKAEEIVKKNRKFYIDLGGEANPETFNKLRELGYDVIIEDNGDRAFLYPETLKYELEKKISESCKKRLNELAGITSIDELENIAKKAVMDIGEDLSFCSKEGKCAQISEEIHEQLQKKGIDCDVIEVSAGYLRREEIFSTHYYVFVYNGKIIIDTQLWQVGLQPKDLSSRKCVFTWEEYNKFFQPTETQKITESLNESDILKKSPEEIIKYVGNDTSGFNSRQDAIEELEYLLSNNFPDGFKNIPNEVILYRVVLIENGEKINEEQIGEHFISSPKLIDIGFLEKIGVIDNWSEDSRLWLLKCLTNKDNIDIERTIGNRLLYPRENEFTVFDGKKIKILDKKEIKKSKLSLSENSGLNENINQQYKKDILYGLKQHAKYFDNYEDFENFYSIKGNHGIYYHITDSPNFQISQQTGPRDMSSMASGKVSEKGALMVTSDLEYWDGYYNSYDPDAPEDENIKRNYVAIVDLSEIEPSKLNPTQRGFGHEIYLKPSDAMKAKVIKILSIQDARKFNDNFDRVKPNSERELKKLWSSVKNKKELSENKLPDMHSMLKKYKLRYPKNNTLIIVNINKLLARHKHDEPDYAFDTRETSNYPGRVERAKEYWKNYAEDPRPISPKDGTRRDWGDMTFEAPYVTIDDGRLGFSDGRHRTIAMKELGYDNIIIEVPKSQVRLFDELK